MSELAEESVLGAVMLEPEAAGDVVNELAPEMFTSPARRAVFQAVNSLYRDRKNIDFVTVSGAVPDCREYLVRLAETIPKLGHLPDYIRIVQEDWQLREMQGALDMLRYREASVEGLLDSLDRLVAENRKLCQSRGDTGVTSFDQVFQKFRAWLEENSGQSSATGFARMDSFTGGCREGTMLTLGGRPGSGKTDFALNLALRLAKRGIKCIYFTMEMSDVDLMRRAVSHMLQINGARIRDRALTREELAAVKGMADTVAQWDQISFVYEGQLSLQDVRRRVELHRPRVVFIDHIGLMKRPQAANAYRELGLLSNQIKQLALEENICVVALSQMNRQVENRAGREPNLSDLRESGDLEQDSDFIGFLQPQAVKGRRLTGADSMDSFLVVKKAREGQMEGRVLYHWQPQYHRFVEVEQKYAGI